MSTEIKNIWERHSAAINHGLNSIDMEEFQRAADVILHAIYTGKRIYTAGNGASAAIAQHWACDYTKGSSDLINNFKPRVISLADNVPLITAISNDISYDEIYAYQIERLADPGDVFISISSSGNSPSVVQACKAALALNMSVVALTGFSGGITRELAHHKLHVDVQEYEAVEDVHQAIMHMIAKYIRGRCVRD